jgi:hypothetical protein
MEDNAYEEFASNTIGHLKDFLARGLSCTGSKQQLVSRCFVAWESKTPLKFTEQQQLSRQNKIRFTNMERVAKSSKFYIYFFPDEYG